MTDAPYQIFEPDWWGFVAILCATLALTFWAGVEWCKYHHKQRGIEVDRLSWHDVLPLPPPPTIVPDEIPDWVEEEQEPWTSEPQLKPPAN